MRHIVLALMSVVGGLLVINAISMLYDPEWWFWNVPGVARTGLYNQHFIRDIAILYLMIGGAVLVGVFRDQRRIELWGVSGLWLTGHAIFHFMEVAAGICGPQWLVVDFPAVTAPAILAILATVWAYSQKTHRGHAEAN